jgi:hypothetical protein
MVLSGQQAVAIQEIVALAITKAQVVVLARRLIANRGMDSALQQVVMLVIRKPQDIVVNQLIVTMAVVFPQFQTDRPSNLNCLLNKASKHWGD